MKIVFYCLPTQFYHSNSNKSTYNHHSKLASNSFTSFNFTKQKAGFPMPSTVPVDSDPNKNPADNFKHIREFQLKGSVTPILGSRPVYCLFDHSGSNAGCAGLMKLIANAILTTGNSDTTIIPFGSNRNNEYQQFAVARYHPTYNNCHWGTYTNFISKFF